jgi:hypothetical protein
MSLKKYFYLADTYLRRTLSTKSVYFRLVEFVRGVPLLDLYFIRAALGSCHPKRHLGSSV